MPVQVEATEECQKAGDDYKIHERADVNQSGAMASLEGTYHPRLPLPSVTILKICLHRYVLFSPANHLDELFSRNYIVAFAMDIIADPSHNPPSARLSSITY